MEYQFNSQLELNILDKDLRSVYCGKVTALTNIICLLLQAIGGSFLIRILGLQRCHILIPALLLGSWCVTLFFPTFAVFSFAYIFLKSVDFSFFNIAREMLYAPLPLDAKYRAKAVIDVFAYRTSKAFMSLGILGLQAVAGAYLFSVTSAIAATIFISWLLIAIFFFRKNRTLVSN
jgi:AAA family ATP:ADP antiporter